VKFGIVTGLSSWIDYTCIRLLYLSSCVGKDQLQKYWYTFLGCSFSVTFKTDVLAPCEQAVYSTRM